jgi:uncharacterized membrane-anchored protein YjiN (DUF445 family)
MPPSVPANSRVPFLSNFSASDRQLFDKTLQQRKLEARQAGEARAAKAARARESAAKAMRDALGATNHRALREFMQQERQALRDSLQPPKGLGQDASKLRQAMARKADATLRRLGVDKAKLAGIAAKYHEALDALQPAVKATQGFHLRGNLKKWQALSKLHAVPLNWGTSSPIPTTRIAGSCFSRRSSASTSSSCRCITSISSWIACTTSIPAPGWSAMR